MTNKIKLDGKTYDLSLLSADGLRTFEMLKFASSRLEHAQQRQEALRHAQNSYVDDLRAEIVKGRSGVDLLDLLSD